MKSHIMLCFLSNVKIDRDTKEISVARYQNIGEKKDCKTTNESAVRYLLCGEDAIQEKLSKLFLVRTKMVAGEIHGYKAREVWERSHYDYFLHRISDIVPDAKDIAEAIAFDEGEPMEQNMNVLIDVATRVRVYAQDVRSRDSDAEIVLHVDCTGGPRNASMILVALMRLLEYERIEIGKVLYSNYNQRDSSKSLVEEVKPLYSFFDLVAGAEEFVRHGEVTVLNKFFEKRERSINLDTLLNAMQKFAEELKLCHYGDLRDAIGALRRAIDAFSAAPSFDVSATVRQNDDLMRQMLGRIKYDYDTILTEELDDIALIRWCVSHSLLQQAMTLLTERVPEILAASGFLRIAPIYQEHFTAELTKDSMRRSSGFFLVNEYRPEKLGKTGNLDAARAEWRKKRQAFFKVFRQEVLADQINDFVDAPVSNRFEVRLQDAETLRAFLLWLNQMRHSEMCSLQSTEEGAAYLEKIELIYTETTKGDWQELLANKDSVVVAKLIKVLGNAGGKDRHCAFLDIEWKPGVRRLHESGIIAGDPVRAAQILDNYFKIKDERNHTNHARAEKGRTAVDGLKNIMEQILNDTEEACRMGKEQA